MSGPGSDVAAKAAPQIQKGTTLPELKIYGDPTFIISTVWPSALSAALAHHIHRPVLTSRYDMRPFDPAVKVAQVMDFYAELTGREQTRHMSAAAIAM